MRLYDAAAIIRSKNAGPFTVTVDLFFGDEPKYAAARSSSLLTAEGVAAAYGVPDDQVKGVWWDDRIQAAKVSLHAVVLQQRPVLLRPVRRPSAHAPGPRRAGPRHGRVMKFGILLTSIHDASVDPASSGQRARGAGAHRRAARLRPHGVRPALPRLGAALLPTGSVADPPVGGRSDHARRDRDHPAVDGQPGRHRRTDGHPRRAERRPGGLRRGARLQRPRVRRVRGGAGDAGGPVRGVAADGRAHVERREVDVAGRFHSVRGARPSVLPLQQGGPPVWVGGQAAGAVKRAARMGDAWYAPPFPTHAELAPLRQLFLDTRADAGLPTDGAFPVRRELLIASSRRPAWRRRSSATAPATRRTGSGACRGEHPVGRRRRGAGRHRGPVHPREPGASAPTSWDRSASELGMTHFVYKPHWPGLPHRDAMAQLEEFGTERRPGAASHEARSRTGRRRHRRGQRHRAGPGRPLSPRAGWRSSLADVEQGTLDAAVEELTATGASAIGARVDVRRPDDLENLAGEGAGRVRPGRRPLQQRRRDRAARRRSGSSRPRTGSGSSTSTCTASPTGSGPSCRPWSPPAAATSSTPPRWPG